MRISEAVRIAAAAALVMACAGSAVALDPEKPTPQAAAPVKPMSIIDAFKSGTRAFMEGNKVKAINELQYAAEHGHAGAQWKLGKIYADGDGVRADPYRSYRYYSQVAAENSDTSPFLPQSRFVASAFVALGNYHLKGIPNTEVHRDPSRAAHMFRYAATYFGDANGQYNLAKLYLSGIGTPKDPRVAARWLYSAATKGQYQAQALLGEMMIRGEGVPKQAARGLMWLTLALDTAKAQGDEEVAQAYTDAVTTTTEDDRIVARTYLEEYLRANR